MFRRQFFKTAAASVAATTFLTRQSFADDLKPGDPPFKISLAEWSLHRALRDESKKLTNLDFPRIAKREFGIEAVEFVNQFFKDKAKDETYLAELKQRCDDEGVKSLLIMVDGEGQLGAPEAEERTRRSRITTSGSMPPSSWAVTRFASMRGATAATKNSRNWPRTVFDVSASMPSRRV